MKKQYFAPICDTLVLPSESLLGPSSNINNTPVNNAGGDAPMRKINGLYI